MPEIAPAANAGSLESSTERDRREAYTITAIIFACYMIDAVLLGGYALLGNLPWGVPLFYAATGVTLAGTLRWLAWRHGHGVLIAQKSVLAQVSVALGLVLGVAWQFPMVGMPMILTVVIIVASSALRMTPTHLVATIAATTVALVLLISQAEQPPAFAVGTRGELLVTAVFLVWTMLKSASINAVGRQLRAEIDRSHTELTRALDQVERLAALDELTELPNRRSILAHVAAARDRLLPGGPPLGVGMLDIDHFKRINDQHGHPVGDAVLRGLASALTGGLRGGDLVGRIGGEEFVVLLRGPFDPDTLQLLGERLRSRVASHPWDGIVPGLEVTASLGLTLGRPGESVEAWLARADGALYRAKAKGRNRVELAIDTADPVLDDALSYERTRPLRPAGDPAWGGSH